MYIVKWLSGFSDSPAARIKVLGLHGVYGIIFDFLKVYILNGESVLLRLNTVTSSLPN